MRSWSFHSCTLDRECRAVDAGHRVYFGTPWGVLIVSLTWGSRIQLWLPWKTTGVMGEKSNYSRWWSLVAWYPRSEKSRDKGDRL